MRLPHPRLAHLLIAVLLIAVLVIKLNSNVFDIVFFLVGPESYKLPLSIHCNRGRLGNQICTYATLYGLSKLNRRHFVLQHCNKKRLSHIFVGPSRASHIVDKYYIRWNEYEILPYLKSSDVAVPRSTNFIAGYIHPCSFTFFDHVRDQLRQDLKFRDHLLSHAQHVIRHANVHDVPNATYVGVHVRRGDYQRHWLEAHNGVPVNTEYFRRAVKYFRDKYRNVLFVAVSDDRLWCIDHLSAEFGMYVPPEAPAPEYDMAVLASCNHTILTFGTFGFWGAYLAGGEVLYYDKFLNPNTVFAKNKFRFEKMYPPYWKGIATVNASRWLAEDASTAAPTDSSGNSSATPATNSSLVPARTLRHG